MTFLSSGIVVTCSLLRIRELQTFLRPPEIFTLPSAYLEEAITGPKLHPWSVSGWNQPAGND